MKKKNQGALTLEAAIVLPVYVFAILTLSYMIQSYYVQDLIDAAAAAAIQDVANKFFYLDQMGVIDITDQIAARTKDSSEKLEATIEKSKQVVDDAVAIKDDIFSLGDVGKVFASKKGVIQIIKALLPFKKELMGKFKDVFGKLKNSKQNVQDIFGNVKDLASDPKGLGLTLATKSVSKGLQYFISSYMLKEIRGRMGQNADRYRIRRMTVDMGENGILYTDKNTGLDRLLTVNIKYKIAIPLFIAPEVEMEKTVRKTIRAWIGD